MIKYSTDFKINTVQEKIPGVLANVFLDAVEINNLAAQWVYNKIQHGKLLVFDEFKNESNASLKKSIIAEIYYDSNQYVLLYGIWYKVDNRFMDILNLVIIHTSIDLLKLLPKNTCSLLTGNFGNHFVFKLIR